MKSTDLSFVDGEVNTLENFLFGFGNDRSQTFDFEEELFPNIGAEGGLRFNGG